MVRSIVNEHFPALSLLYMFTIFIIIVLRLNYPYDIVITINNSAMNIIFSALWKSLR